MLTLFLVLLLLSGLAAAFVWIPRLIDRRTERFQSDLAVRSSQGHDSCGRLVQGNLAATHISYRNSSAIFDRLGFDGLFLTLGIGSLGISGSFRGFRRLRLGRRLIVCGFIAASGQQAQDQQQ